MKKKAKVEKENGERWLLTYSDLITLLMIFFVMMYAMSNIDTKKYAQVASSLNSAFGGGGSSPSVIGDGGSSAAVVGVENVVVDGTAEEAANKTEQTKLENLKKEVDGYLQKSGLGSSASTVVEERGLAISISDTLFFDSGKADLKSGTEAKILEIGNILRPIDNYINIEGNTDNVAISNKEFKDNYDLAYTRAVNVLRVLLKAGINPAKIAAKSDGENRPVASNDTEEGRASNRRVDIIILNNKLSASETNTAK